MTGEEIAAYGKRLTGIVARMDKVTPTTDTSNPKLLDDLRQLALEVGACPAKTVLASGLSQGDKATAPELVSNIHQALQTWSMIDACRTAAKNHEVAVAAMKETAESLRISKHTMRAAWIAAVAAWVAVILPPLIRLVWAMIDC